MGAGAGNCIIVENRGDLPQSGKEGTRAPIRSIIPQTIWRLPRHLACRWHVLRESWRPAALVQFRSDDLGGGDTSLLNLCSMRPMECRRRDYLMTPPPALLLGKGVSPHLSPTHPSKYGGNSSAQQKNRVEKCGVERPENIF